MTISRNSLLLMPFSAMLVFASGVSAPAFADAPPVSQEPLSVGVGQAAPPLNMLVMGRDHKLYYEAYNDASDLNGDGVLDVGYKGHLSADQGGIDYFGYFDSHRCYSYNAGASKFVPGAAAPNKTCNNAWSGDFLNYLTTSRMDAMRKVLYGGYRVVDDVGTTTLERVYVPQDAHSWGKEYTSFNVDGYFINDYAPLAQPVGGRRHLFANVTLRNSENLGPLLRVATNSGRRIWNWVAKENPVAGDSCTGGPCAGENVGHPGHPRSRGAFDVIEADYAVAANLLGTSYLDRIDCNGSNCNPYGDDDNYMTVITGQIEIRQAGNYIFISDGDDNIDFTLYGAGGAVIAQSGCYPNGRGFNEWWCGDGTVNAVANDLPAGTYSFKFRHEEAAVGDGYLLKWERRSAPSSLAADGSLVEGGVNWGGQNFQRRVMRVVDQDGNVQANTSGGFVANPEFKFYTLIPDNSGSAMTNYRVRVDVCVAGIEEANCKRYPNGRYKPTGILHDYGESDRMMFGLLTGSYAKNTQGGVLRKNMSSFNNEVDSNTGQFTADVGIVKTIDRLRTIDFNAYQYTCGWIANRPINDGECSMWGNPIAEMMYESLRYLGGAAAPRSEFDIAANAKDALDPLNLPRPDWISPYVSASEGGGGYLRCATPVMTVVSDINPSYDGSVPGSNWSNISAASDPAPINTLDVAGQVDAIWGAEGGGSRSVFIGESGGTYDSNPTVKTVSNLSSVRGLAPEEPSKEGTYYSAGVARFGATNAIGGDKNAMTYAVALASPLPRLEFPVGGRTITVVPFAKSPYGRYGGNVNPGDNFQPTNQIVDFFVQRVANTNPDCIPGAAGCDADLSINGGRPYAEFRINYEDVEQGADHDMDAIVLYTFEVTEDNDLRISLNSEYASGSIVQYMGYIISGTTKDGIYLEVSDCDTTSTHPGNGYCPSGSNGGVRYAMNTPPGRDAGYCVANLASEECNTLPYSASRTFEAGSTSGAELLNDPLWFAAKYGRPSSYTWDDNSDGTPDNYFLVTNAGTLKDQLAKAFSQIVQDTQASGGVAASGARATVDLMAYVPEYTTTDWTGDLRAHKLDPGTGALRPMLWSAKAKLAAIANDAIPVQNAPASGRNVYYIDAADNSRQPFTLAGLGGDVAASAKLGVGAVSSITGVATEDWVNYLRGDHRREQSNGGPFRNRGSRIGDIFSQPVVLDKASYGYSFLPEGGDDYRDFVEEKEDRVAVAFVAANDGFLHAFNATDNASSGGSEIFAIAPNGVLDKMAQLASPSYSHRFYVDGSPTQGDAYLGNEWRTVLVGSLGAGGRSVYALDVTDPANDDWDVLWEFTDADLGLTMGSPKIARLPNGKWAAIFGGTGYETANNNAYLYIVDLETGSLIQKVMVNDEGTDDLPNGLSTPAVIDLDGDGITDIVYAGDYYGNLWKFDLTSSGTTLNVAKSKLFTAVDSVSDATANKVRQPVTGGVTASIHPIRGQLVFFGTGRYMLEGDNAAPVASDQIQSFYAIWDDNGAAVSRDALVEQTFVSSAGGRGTSSNTVSWGDHKGWFIDLKTSASGANGERFIGQPTVAMGRVFFTSFVSQGDECEPGGTNWINSLWATSGTGALGGGGASQPLTGSSGPITSAITIVTGRTGGDEGSGGCAPDDASCVDPGATDEDGDGEADTDLGLATPRGCVLNVDMLTAVGLNPLLRLSCGRQSWRQLQ